MPTTGLGLTSGTPKVFKVCAYAGTTGSNTQIADTDPANFTVQPTLTPAGGPTGTTITVKSAASTFSAGAPGAIFTTNTTCPTNYTTTITGQTTAAGATPAKVDDNTATFTVPAAGLALSSGLARQYNVCIYNGSATTSTLITDGTQTFTLTPGITLSATAGASGGGNTINFTAPTGSSPFTNVPGVVFSSTNCPVAYGTPTSNLVATNIARTSTSAVSATVPAGVLATGVNTPYTVCFYNGTGASDALIGASAAAYNITLPPVTLSSSVGSSAGTAPGAITVSSTSNFLVGVTAPGVAFTTAPTCPTIYPANVTFAAASGSTPVTHGVIQASGAGIRVLAGNRLAVQVPALPLSLGTPTQYQMCVYNGTSTSTSTLVANAGYTSTTVHTLTAVTPSAGTAMGGDEIVITGTGFPTSPGSITASLGGTPLQVTPVNANTFTAVTPMHAPESNVPLVVTTNAGTRTLSSAFSYLNALKVMPNTAPNTRAIDLAVSGSDFLAVSFGNNATDAHIYLVRGEYNSRAVVASGNKVNGPVQECGNVLVISDNDLVCNLNLANRLDPSGAPMVAAVPRTAADVVTVSGSRTVTSAANALFTVADIGKMISGDGIPAGTMITDITPAASGQTSSSAVLSRAATAGATITGTIGGAQRQVPLVVTTNSSQALTAPPGTFTQGDVNRPITGGNVGSGNTIATVAAGGASATLQTAAAGSGGGTHTLSIYGDPVPNGSYNLTYVSNGSLDAVNLDPNYSQSVVSSGSAFTVAPF
ncbi:beta strand repeat-containing protein [Actinoplanes philippinensis]|uniref:beta strand repeat-containing protein n=1 Tax=Actinoplanes philippinensis TaxID=35752 RepID=UPI0033D2DB9F